MELSKDYIVSKSFSKKFMGGLSEFEVRDFLHVLAEEIRHLRQKNNLQKKKLEDQKNLIQDYKDREHILRESIASAEEWSRKIRKDAEKNAELTLEKAQGKANALVQEARLSLQNVYNDIADLKRLRLQFKTGLKAALQVQMELLDQEPVFSSQLPEDKKELLEEKSSFQDKKPLTSRGAQAFSSSLPIQEEERNKPTQEGRQKQLQGQLQEQRQAQAQGQGLVVQEQRQGQRQEQGQYSSSIDHHSLRGRGAKRKYRRKYRRKHRNKYKKKFRKKHGGKL